MTLLQKLFFGILFIGFISCGPSDGKTGEVDMNDDTKMMKTAVTSDGESDRVRANVATGRTEASRVGQMTDDNDGKLDVNIDYSFDNNYGTQDDSYITRAERLQEMREKGIVTDTEALIPADLTQDETVSDEDETQIKYVSMGEAYRQKAYSREGNVLENDNDLIYSDNYDKKVVTESQANTTENDMKTKAERMRDNSPAKKEEYQELNKELINPDNRKDN